MYNGLPSTHADWLTPQTAQPRLHGRMISYPSSCVCMIISTGQHVAMHFALLFPVSDFFYPPEFSHQAAAAALKLGLLSCHHAALSSEAKQSADAASRQPNETTG